MPARIRLQRHGRKRRPFYKIVVADVRSPRDGKYLDKVGVYNPTTIPATIELDIDKAIDWLHKGAQPTDTVRAILSFKGAMYKKHLLRGVDKGVVKEGEVEKLMEKWFKEKDERTAKQQDSKKKKKDEAIKNKENELAAKIKEEEAAKAPAPEETAPEAVTENPAEPEVKEETAPAAKTEVAEKQEAPKAEKKEEAEIEKPTIGQQPTSEVKTEDDVKPAVTDNKEETAPKAADKKSGEAKKEEAPKAEEKKEEKAN